MHWYDKQDHRQEPALDLALAENVQRVEVYRPPEMIDIMDKIGAWMKVHAFSSRDVFAVSLALHEAATNAFRHGNRGDCSKWVRISYLVTADDVLIRVEDQGDGFDPEQVPDPYRPENLNRPVGRGLMLIRAYSTSVCYAPPGNRVTFSRRRTNAQ
jgi:serine/threonine-protein kinase RsbW